MPENSAQSGATGEAEALAVVMHVVAHSHWDREWYMPFQRHRARLVELLDDVLELLERDPAFTSFHLDGQTIVLDDYLEIRPERRSDLERLARAGRLIVGPWYIQPDEFLVSGEALVRNLLHGVRASRAYGGAARIGYLPDTFGHISQMPQILRGFDIDNAIFGRGLPQLVETPAGPQPGQIRSEVIWQSPDGSSVLGIVLATWYHNAAELPTDPLAAAARMRLILGTVAPFATTPHLLLMNGMDHQPVQVDLSAALAAAATAIAPDQILQDSIPGYVAAVQPVINRSQLPTVVGELRGQGTDGWNTLANTASSRLYLKRMNHDAQVAIERYAEPLAAMAALCNVPYPYDLLRFAWMRLLQNQPHDSICGCSLDAVHEDMLPRFRDSLEVARLVAHDAVSALGAAVLSAHPAVAGSWPVLVVNTLAWPRGGPFEVEVDLARRECASPPGPDPDPRDLSDVDVAGLHLRTQDGTPLPAVIDDLGVVWDYELPPDRGRRPYHARRLRVRTTAPAVPGLGYQLLWLSSDGAAHGTDVGVSVSPLQAGPDWLENEHLRVDAALDGSLTITDKSTDERYAGLNVFEDCGDVGDQYVFRAAGEDAALTTAGRAAVSITTETTLAEVTLRIAHALEVPAGAEPAKPGRGVRRSTAMVTLNLETTVRLRPGGHAVEISCHLDNVARDHRLRALFPTGVTTAVCAVDSAFDVVERRITPWAGWQNPTDAQPQQAFVDLSDGRRGLLIANRGLPEYEVMRDAESTLALTLLRCVGHLGDWGVFPTPGAQCPGSWTAEYAIIPHTGSWEAAARWAREFVTPLHAVQARPGSALPAAVSARLPAGASLLRIAGDALVLAACKRAEDRESIIVRLYNPTAAPCPASLSSIFPLAAAYLTTLEERRLRPLTLSENSMLEFVVAPRAIVTLELATTAE